MPKKKSVRLCSQQFREEAKKLLEYCETAHKKLPSNEHLNLVYDGAVIKLYSAFERMMIGALTGAINNDTSRLSTTTNVQFPKHLTDEVCEYIIIGSGYFNFRGRDGLIGEVRKYVPCNHYLVEAVKNPVYKDSLDLLCTLRDYAAHGGTASKNNALTATGQKRIGSSGSWLKSQNRFQDLISKINELSEDIEKGAPF